MGQTNGSGIGGCRTSENVRALFNFASIMVYF